MPFDPASPINQDEINAILWKACDTFRGTVDPSEYKNYILVMLFLKYISDIWQDRKEELQKELPPERVQRRLELERFIIPENADYYSLYEKRHAENIGELVDIALAAIENANISKLQGVFRNISYNSSALGETKDRNKRIRNLLEDFHDPKLNMKPSRINGQDIIGNAYEYLIARFAAGAGKKGGEFYTPGEVSTLMARLLDPQPGERIYDPACGSGSLLIKCAKQVGSNNYSLYGQESNGSTWALAMMNMFLHDMQSPHIAWGDTLNNPQHTENGMLTRFNVVTANPPFSLDKWGADDAGNDLYQRFWRGIPPKGTGDYAFITHMIESTYLEPQQNGRVAVIAPHGVLFRGGAEGRIRQQFIEEKLLDGVIGLAPNLFYGTGIPVAILIFKRNKSDNSVFFIDASTLFEAGSNQNRLRESDMHTILQIWQDRQNVDKLAYLATFEELEENDFNLNIPRYVDTFEPEPLVDMPAVNAELRQLKGELNEVETRMAEYLKELGLDE